MSFWSKFDCFNYFYQTSLSARECVNSILVSQTILNTDSFNPLRYEFSLLADNQILLVFKGSRFGKITGTQYLATFHDDIGGCRILLAFQHELLGLPPMTSTYHLDVFMKEKLQAYRCH